MNRFSASIAAASTVALAVSQLAWSQEASRAPSSDALEEIVVTAEKVETNVQRTAIAIDVYAGQQLQELGVHDVNSLANVAPAVNVTGNTGGGTIVAIRGISSRDTTEVGDPAVAISTDGFYVDRSYAIGLTQYDLERIEVLKGPQGTLYGRNATGGAINILTAKPGKEFGGFATLEMGNFNTTNTEGAINVPLGDKVQMRASFTSNFHDGYVDAGANGRFDDQNARSGRLQFAFQPTENLDLHVLVQETTQRSNPQGAYQTPYRIDANGFVDHTTVYSPPDPRKYAMPAGGHLYLTDKVFRWDANLQLPGAKLTYLGGYDTLDWNQLTPTWFFASPQTATNTPVGQARQFNQTEKPHTFNHEVRAANLDPSARFTWQVGAFYFTDRNDLDSFNRQVVGTPVIRFIYSVYFKSISEFGQVGFKLTDNLKLSAGIRHNQDNKTRDGNIYQGPLQAQVPSHAKTEASKNTFHVGLDWQASPDSLVYAKYDTGYKAAGFTDIAPYGEETVKAIEVGTKNRFFDNRLQLNADIFSDDYTGQQVQQIVSGGGGLRIVNAGKSKIKGIEVEPTFVTPVGRIELNVAYLDAKFTEFVLAAGIPNFNGTAWTSPNVNLVLTGNRPPQAPEMTIGGAWEKTWSMGSGASLTTRLSAKSTSKQYFSFFNRLTDTQGAATISNLNVTYKTADAKWDIQGYVRNLSDAKVYSNIAENDRSFGYTFSYAAPRTYGLRLTAHF
jgi:iron complex outermembrane receptor protein